MSLGRRHVHLTERVRLNHPHRAPRPCSDPPALTIPPGSHGSLEPYITSPSSAVAMFNY